MSKTMTIAFRNGGIIPKAVLKKDADLPVRPHEAVKVPAEYGQQLVDDRFAYEVLRGKTKGSDDASAAAQREAADKLKQAKAALAEAQQAFDAGKAGPERDKLAENVQAAQDALTAAEAAAADLAA